MIYQLIPESLEHNPVWRHYYKCLEFIWEQNVIKHIPNITKPLDVTTDTASREDILLKASRIGWTFTDNFSANWEDDDRAKRFLNRFIQSWQSYCRNNSGTNNLARYMSYLLGMEIRIVQLWSNCNEYSDLHISGKLYRMESQRLPDDYLINTSDEEPFDLKDLNKYTYSDKTLMSQSDLNNKHIGWKTVEEDPINGWYPTSQFDVYVDLELVPSSDLQEKSAEEIIASLFYELADINQVLRAIVYSYNFTQVVKIASGMSILNHMGESGSLNRDSNT